MAQEHDQDGTNRQKPDLNKIRPGMEVEDTACELDESDMSKPLVTQVIREEQGQVAYLVGMAFALLGVDPIKLSFFANVFTGVLAPVMVVYLMVIGNSREIMGEHRLGWLTNFFLAATALVLITGSALFFYGLATGQAGS